LQKRDRHFELKLYVSYSQHLKRNFWIFIGKKKTFPNKVYVVYLYTRRYYFATNSWHTFLCKYYMC